MAQHGTRSAPDRRRARGPLALALVAALALTGAVPSQAVSSDHGDSVVADVPVASTPHVVNGSVQSFVQVGSMMVAAGTFTTVRQTPTGPDVTRNGIFAFDAVTGQIDPDFDPNLGGTANSLDSDGTHIYVGGSFGSVGGVTSTRRLARLNLEGDLVPGLKVPSAGVNDVVVRGDRLFIGGQFTSVGGTPRGAFAVLDTRTGLVLPQADVPFTGTYNGGSSAITRMDVTPDGSRVVAVGNFITVAGQAREQIALLDTPAGAAATVSTWSTDRLTKVRNAGCSKNYETWTRDVDISPDGRWFVVTTTGAFGGGANAGAMCDTTSRWELGRTGGLQEPSWVAYTGGDTTYGVAVTGSVVYTGGHMRWQNNPFQGDQAGPGAVSREGVAALDARNGLPLSWNPGRTRGVGAQAMYATPTGLWVGSDTDRLADRLRMRVAFLPLAGGSKLPSLVDAPVANGLLAATRSTTPASASGVLYRVNAGGGALQSGDHGPDWTSDSGRVTGGSSVAYAAVPATEAAVPASTPAQVFSTERVGVQRYALPVATGRSVVVRLYFANQAATTASAGQRTFDVRIDGRLVLDDFDVVAATGSNRRGTVRVFPVTSDGSVDIDLGAVVNNPSINAVEVLDAALAAQTPAPGVLQRRAMDASGAAVSAPVTSSTVMDFSRVRGATLAAGSLYYGLPDGGLHARSYDARTGALGPQRTVDLHDDPEDGRRIALSVANMTGMAFDATTHRLYYTVLNDARLFYRAFTPESEVVGSQGFVVTVPGTSFATAAGLAVADGRLLWGSTADGRLRSAPFSAGVVTGPATVVDADGTWRHRALLVSPLPPAKAPTASFTASCDRDRLCTFDGSGSADPDGTVADHAWAFGDGSTGSGAVTTHSYAADGTVTVTLSVTDDSGSTGTTSRPLDVVRVPNQAPTAAFTSSCVHLTCSFDATGSQDPDGSLVQHGWTFGEGDAAGSGARTSHTYTGGGERTVTLTVTDDRGATARTTRVLSPTPPPPPVSTVAFRDATSVQGNLVTVTVQVPATVQAGDALVLSLTQNAARSLSVPSGTGTWADHGTQAGDNDQIRTTTWSRVAVAGDAGTTISVTLSARAKVVLSLLAYSGTDPVSPVRSYAAASETATVAAHTTPGATAVPAGSWVVSGWADMTSATTDWVPPQDESVRVETIGAGSGRTTALVTDRGPVAAGDSPGRTATADSASRKAISWTLVLSP